MPVVISRAALHAMYSDAAFAVSGVQGLHCGFTVGAQDSVVSKKPASAILARSERGHLLARLAVIGTLRFEGMVTHRPHPT